MARGCTWLARALRCEKIPALQNHSTKLQGPLVAARISALRADAGPAPSSALAVMTRSTRELQARSIGAHFDGHHVQPRSLRSWPLRCSAPAVADVCPTVGCKRPRQPRSGCPAASQLGIHARQVELSRRVRLLLLRRRRELHDVEHKRCLLCRAQLKHITRSLLQLGMNRAACRRLL